ncbi:hypothetical protein [Sediminicola luteus]|uniref:Seryl-tRNA synthetase n=1 Tax=Sediminicola luteus TaxID=319238 RepID=A0ABV2TSI4_9FLAO
MKKYSIYLMMAFTMLSLIPSNAMAANEPATELMSNSTPDNAALAKTLLARLDEIKAMDKSNLSRLEKKALRVEVRETKAELKSMNGGVYLSVGAIIVIILLLILLL